MIPQWLCRVMPYLHRSEWGIGKALHLQGYKQTPSSRGIAWGWGHPHFRADFSDPNVMAFTCIRCDSRMSYSITEDA